MSEPHVTDRALKLLELAENAARRLGSDGVTPEHVLLGLLQEGEGVAAAVLQNFQVDLDRLHDRMAAVIPASGPPSESDGGESPAAARTQRLMTVAAAEATKLGHAYLGTEHILLALLQEPDSTAAKLLAAHDVRYDHAVAETRRLLGV